MAAPAEAPSCHGGRLCVCVGLRGYNRWGIYCSDSVRSHWWQYQWDITHMHEHTETDNWLQKNLGMHTHCHMQCCSGDGWRMIRLKKLYNDVVLFWMHSVTSCQLFTLYTLHVSVCEEQLVNRRMFPVVGIRQEKDRKLSNSSLFSSYLSVLTLSQRLEKLDPHTHRYLIDSYLQNPCTVNPSDSYIRNILI